MTIEGARALVKSKDQGAIPQITALVATRAAVEVMVEPLEEAVIEAQQACARSAAMGPVLKERGLVFVGIDVIGGEWLTEINVTSPTGIVAIDRFNGSDTGGLIWDAIEARHGAMLRG